MYPIFSCVFNIVANTFNCGNKNLLKLYCIMCSAPDDIPKADKIRSLVKDIWDLRVAKLRSSIDIFVKSDSTHAKVFTCFSLC